LLRSNVTGNRCCALNVRVILGFMPRIQQALQECCGGGSHAHAFPLNFAARILIRLKLSRGMMTGDIRNPR
jgi:hypothetical protein